MVFSEAEPGLVIILSKLNPLGLLQVYQVGSLNLDLRNVLDGLIKLD